MCIFILLIYTSFWKRPSISLGYFFYPSKGLSKDIIYQIFKYFCLIMIFLSHIAHLFIYITVIYVMNDSRKEYRFNNFERCLLSKFDKKKVIIFLQDSKKYLKGIWLILFSTMCFTSCWIKNSCFRVFATTCVLCNITNGFIIGFNK